MIDEESVSGPEPEKIEEQSKKSVAKVRELVKDLKTVEEYEQGINSRSD